MKKIIYLISLLFLLSQSVFCNKNDDFNLKNTELHFMQLLEEGNFEKADSIADFFIKNSKNSYNCLICTGYYYKAEIAYYQTEWSIAEEYYQKTIDCLQDDHDMERLATSYNNLGLVYLYKSYFNKALEAFTQSLEYELKMNDPLGIAQAYQNMAIVFDNQNNIKKAIELNLLACDILVDTDNDEELAVIYNNLAALFSEEENFKNAENYYNKALAICINYNLTDLEAKVICNLGFLYVRQGKFNAGSEILEKALALFKQRNDVESEINAYEMLAGMYAMKNEYSQAVFLSETAWEIAEQTDFYALKMKCLYSLYSYNKKLGNWKEALERFEQYYQLQSAVLMVDLLPGEEVLKIQLDQKNNEINHLNHQIREIKSNFRIILILLSLIIIIIIIVVRFYFWKSKTELNSIKAEQDYVKIQAELTKNSLISLQNTEIGKIIEYLPVLTSINDDKPNNIKNISSEINYIQNFINLYKNLYNKEIRFHLETNITDDKLNQILIPSLLFKLSVDHFLFHKKDEKRELFFNLAFMIKDEEIKVTIEENVSQPFYLEFDKENKLFDYEVFMINKKINLLNKTEKNYFFTGIAFEGNKTRYGFGLRKVLG